MAGRIALDDQDKSIQSACSLPIYQRSKEILNLKTKDERRLELEKLPEKIRPHIEKEIMRLWRIRND